MVKLNRTSEYGLIALRHMFRKQRGNDTSVTSAREVADQYGLPFEITAKTLQRLKDTGLILSAQGARGGYTLNAIYLGYSFGRFISAMEGPVAIVGCTGSNAPAVPCEFIHRCGMTDLMSELNDRVKAFLDGIPLVEILSGNNPDRPAVAARDSAPTFHLNERNPAPSAATVEVAAEAREG